MARSFKALAAVLAVLGMTCIALLDRQVPAPPGLSLLRAPPLAPHHLPSPLRFAPSAERG